MTGTNGGLHHKIDPERWDALARGGGDDRVVDPFWSTERSWRLTALRTLLETCQATPEVTGPLASIDTAWDLLRQAYRNEPTACEDVLSQPQVGLWAAYTFRRIVRSEMAESVWEDIGYLHGIAAACAFRAGVPFELSIPVRHGVAILPTVGAADFPVEASLAQVAFDGRSLVLRSGSVTVEAAPGDPRWHKPVRVEINVEGRSLRLTFLDRDVYRDLQEPGPPRPLHEPEIGRWRDLLGEAWQMLVREQPERAAGLASSVRTLTPEPRRSRYRPASASAAEAYGGILLSEPDDATQLAVTLIHEGQHQKLGALLHMFTMLRSDSSIRYYAPWRDDPRPLQGLLQGVYAFTGVTDFWRVHRRHADPGERYLAEFEFALWRRQAYGVAQVLSGSGRLTGIGRSFVGRLQAQLAAWQDDPVPPGILALAEDMALDHYALWRTYCMPVHKSFGEALATAFRNGEPVPAAVLSGGDQPVVALPEVELLDSRAVLVRHALAGVTDLDAVQVAGSTSSDIELVSGRTDSARERYLRDLERHPGDAHAWVGLGLTLDRKTDPGARALLGRPELVMAMADERTDPLGAARWLGRELAGDELGTPQPTGWRLA